MQSVECRGTLGSGLAASRVRVGCMAPAVASHARVPVACLCGSASLSCSIYHVRRCVVLTGVGESSEGAAARG